ncbi:HD-GYP domain-containing protein [Paenibacillus sp. sgz302251]|uniref:HD-GYP domain-containing protein n=1 Tax=Paenibacillus sp. sgz302251 TaxID=3414493 RepID=UPI003C7BBEEB
MRKEHSEAYQFSGMRLNKNIYNQYGVLVLPAQARLTQKDIELVIHQKISLRHEDMEHASILYLVNSAIKEIKDAFHKIRHSHVIPYEDVRERIIPIIEEMSSDAHFSDVFAHLELRDEYTYRHSIGVALISRLIGVSQGMQEEELLQLTTAGFLHDVGKVKIPIEIINKPGKLTNEEYAEVKNHTVYGFDIIRGTSEVSYRYALVALQHHEREDGSGYPYGLQKQEIDLHSKIVAVADVFHAMISKRAYKNPIPFYHVLKDMSQNAFGSLEPEITLRFLKKIMNLLIGNHVVMSDGSEGKIIMINSNDPVHPLVAIDGQYVDLSKNRTLHIHQII